MYNFDPSQIYYRGKVRDTYVIENKMIMITSNRISAFDHILPVEIPLKGAVLNGVAKYFLDSTADLVPNWLEEMPHPQVAIGKACQPLRVEFVVRGYLAGHAWRQYKKGERILCGQKMPENMRESMAFPHPLLTPATKADSGHDEDIAPEEILEQGLMTAEHFDRAAQYAFTLFQKGTEMAAEKGLILVDTKYEFGLFEGEIVLIDEVHTPDSSRYYMADTYEDHLEQGIPQRQLSKEFVREWLMKHGFQGLEGQEMPEMPVEFVEQISQRYLELYRKLTGSSLEIDPVLLSPASIEKAVKAYLTA